ncbi:MAG: hypothetical protein HYR91_00110 [Flavobacteriia bacterium]|nr:hypothetical protein [Flavobacteriia bacterium]
MKFLLSSTFFLILGVTNAQDSTAKITLDAGVRMKKFTGFYWENGISWEFSSSKIFNQKIHFGFNLLSSRLGSAFMSNAIPTLTTELSVIKYFRIEKAVQPLLRLNLGYAHANYGSIIYKGIASNSALISIETGVGYKFPANFRCVASGGFNAITGNGAKGLGTIYPFYGQFSIFYQIKK